MWVRWRSSEPASHSPKERRRSRPSVSRTSGLALLGKVGHVANKGAKSSSMEERIAVDQAAGSKQASGVSRNAGCVTKPNQTKLSSGRGDGGDCTTRSANHTTRNEEERLGGARDETIRRGEGSRARRARRSASACVRTGGARRTADRQRKREGRRTFPPKTRSHRSGAPDALPTATPEQNGTTAVYSSLLTSRSLRSGK